MQRSFKSRLEALEALEAAQDAESDRPLTAADADALTDDEVLDEALWGLSDDGRPITIGERGLYQVTFTNPVYGPDYWQRICERTPAICRARGVVLFPLAREDTERALQLIDAGVLKARPQPDQTLYSHQSCLEPVFWPQQNWTDYYHLRQRLCHALDAALWQLRMLGEASVLIEDTETLRADLRAVLGERDEVIV